MYEIYLLISYIFLSIVVWIACSNRYEIDILRGIVDKLEKKIKELEKRLNARGEKDDSR